MASGDTLGRYTALESSPQPLNYATLAVRNSHRVLEFVKAVVASAVFEDFLPRNYDGGGITLTVVWAAKTDVANAVVWSAAFERMADGGHDIDSDSFAAFQQAAGTAPADSGVLRYTAIAFTNAQIDGLLKGEAFRLFLRRLTSDGGDTMAGVAQLLRVELRET